MVRSSITGALALCAMAIDMAVVLAWHVPYFHDWATTDWRAYVVEKISFLAVGFIVWYTAFNSAPLLGAATLFLVFMHMTLLGSFLAVSSRTFYDPVDPEHDTPSRLRTYLEQFSPKLVGLTEKPKDMLNILGAYGIYRKRHADGGIDHSAVALLIDAHGILHDRIKESELGSSTALSKLHRLIGGLGHGVMKENEGSS